MLDLATELSDLPTGRTSSPWEGWEAACGYGVMSLPLSSGDQLGLRVFPASDFGGYRSVWHHEPSRGWALYVDGAPVEAGCPRYWGPAVEVAESADIDVTWTGPTSLLVTMDQPLLRWEVTVAEPGPLSVVNMLHGRLPLATWRPRSFVAAREWAARRLGLGALRMSGRVPAGQHLVAALRRMYTIPSATATLAGRDLGKPTTWRREPTIGDWPLPRTGVFAVGEAHATIRDRASYDRLRGGVTAAGQPSSQATS